MIDGAFMVLEAIIKEKFPNAKTDDFVKMHDILRGSGSDNEDIKKLSVKVYKASSIEEVYT